MVVSTKPWIYKKLLAISFADQVPVSVHLVSYIKPNIPYNITVTTQGEPQKSYTSYSGTFN